MRRLAVALVLAALWQGSVAPAAAQWYWAGYPTTNPWAGGVQWGASPYGSWTTNPSATGWSPNTGYVYPTNAAGTSWQMTYPNGYTTSWCWVMC